MILRYLLGVAAMCATAASANADCLLDARSLVSGMVKLPPFHLTIKTTSNGVESKMTGDVIMPNSFKLVFGNTAMIMTPRGAWMSDKGKWKAQSQDVALNMRHTLLSGITDGLATMRNVKCSAKASVGGKTYKSIEFDTYDKPSDKTPLAHVRFFLGKGDLPLWMITQGYSKKGNSAVVQQFIYDSSIKIKDPA